MTHRNPRVFSVDLQFKHAPKDLMKKFVDTLVRLPNLRRLELLDVSHRSPITVGLKRKRASFPNIREILVNCTYPDFIKSCPNLESMSFRRGLDECGCRAMESYGTGLKRVTGVECEGLYSKFIAHRKQNRLTRGSQ